MEQWVKVRGSRGNLKIDNGNGNSAETLIIQSSICFTHHTFNKSRLLYADIGIAHASRGFDSYSSLFQIQHQLERNIDQPPRAVGSARVTRCDADSRLQKRDFSCWKCYIHAYVLKNTKEPHWRWDLYRIKLSSTDTSEESCIWWYIIHSDTHG